MKKKLASLALATASVAGLGMGTVGAAAPANAVEGPSANSSSIFGNSWNHSGVPKYANIADCQKNMAGAIANVYRIGGHLTSQPSCRGRKHYIGGGPFHPQYQYWMTYIGFSYEASRAANPGDTRNKGFWGSSSSGDETTVPYDSDTI